MDNDIGPTNRAYNVYAENPLHQMQIGGAGEKESGRTAVTSWDPVSTPVGTTME